MPRGGAWICHISGLYKCCHKGDLESAVRWDLHARVPRGWALCVCAMSGGLCVPRGWTLCVPRGWALCVPRGWALCVPRGWALCVCAMSGGLCVCHEGGLRVCATEKGVGCMVCHEGGLRLCATGKGVGCMVCHKGGLYECHGGGLGVPLTSTNEGGWGCHVPETWAVGAILAVLAVSNCGGGRLPDSEPDDDGVGSEWLVPAGVEDEAADQLLPGSVPPVAANSVRTTWRIIRTRDSRGTSELRRVLLGAGTVPEEDDGVRTGVGGTVPDETVVTVPGDKLVGRVDALGSDAIISISKDTSSDKNKKKRTAPL